MTYIVSGDVPYAPRISLGEHDWDVLQMNIRDERVLVQHLSFGKTETKKRVKNAHKRTPNGGEKKSAQIK